MIWRIDDEVVVCDRLSWRRWSGRSWDRSEDGTHLLEIWTGSSLYDQTAHCHAASMLQDVRAKSRPGRVGRKRKLRDCSRSSVVLWGPVSAFAGTAAGREGGIPESGSPPRRSPRLSVGKPHRADRDRSARRQDRLCAPEPSVPRYPCHRHRAVRLSVSSSVI